MASADSCNNVIYKTANVERWNTTFTGPIDCNVKFGYFQGPVSQKILRVFVIVNAYQEQKCASPKILIL